MIDKISISLKFFVNSACRPVTLIYQMYGNFGTLTIPNPKQFFGVLPRLLDQGYYFGSSSNDYKMVGFANVPTGV